MSCSGTRTTARKRPSWRSRRSAGPASARCGWSFDTQDAAAGRHTAEAAEPGVDPLLPARLARRANDGFLWTRPSSRACGATELRAGRDIGRSLTTGVSNEQFEIVKWHYIFSDDDTGADDARPVMEETQTYPWKMSCGCVRLVTEWARARCADAVRGARPGHADPGT